MITIATSALPKLASTAGGVGVGEPVRDRENGGCYRVCLGVVDQSLSRISRAPPANAARTLAGRVGEIPVRMSLSAMVRSILNVCKSSEPSRVLTKPEPRPMPAQILRSYFEISYFLLLSSAVHTRNDAGGKTLGVCNASVQILCFRGLRVKENSRVLRPSEGYLAPSRDT